MAGPDIESNGATHGAQGSVGEIAAPTTEAHAEAVPPFVIFLSQEECAQRVNHQALMNYIGGALRIATRIANEPGDPLTVRVYLGLVPQSPTLVQIECFPASATDVRLARLRDQIESLPCPPARGPVAFAIRADLSGGDPTQQQGFHAPFRDLLPDFQGSFDELIVRAASSESAEKPSAAVTINQAANDSVDNGVDAIVQSTGLHRIFALAWRFAQRIFSRPRYASVEVSHSREAPPESRTPTSAAPTIGDSPSWPAQLSLESLTQVIALAPAYLPFYAARGGLLAETGRFEDAVRDFDEVIRQEPAQVNVLFDRGVCYLNLDRLQPALADFNAVLHWLPNSPRTLAARAEVYRRLEAWTAADADLSSAIENDPFEARWRLHRSRFRASSDGTTRLVSTPTPPSRSTPTNSITTPIAARSWPSGPAVRRI